MGKFFLNSSEIYKNYNITEKKNSQSFREPFFEQASSVRIALNPPEMDLIKYQKLIDIPIIERFKSLGNGLEKLIAKYKPTEHIGFNIPISLTRLAIPIGLTLVAENIFKQSFSIFDMLFTVALSNATKLGGGKLLQNLQEFEKGIEIPITIITQNGLQPKKVTHKQFRTIIKEGTLIPQIKLKDNAGNDKIVSNEKAIYNHDGKTYVITPETLEAMNNAVKKARNSAWLRAIQSYGGPILSAATVQAIKLWINNVDERAKTEKSKRTQELMKQYTEQNDTSQPTKDQIQRALSKLKIKTKYPTKIK